MILGGNPEDLRSLARRLRKHADEVEATTTKVKAGQGIQWTGAASDRFRERLIDLGQNLESSRQSVIDAATKADALADVLEERQRAIAAAMDQAMDALDQARGTVQKFAGKVWNDLTHAEQDAENGAKEVLKAVQELPPPGDPRWLEILGKVVHR
jgi:hypothetical protein